ncbi:hypothetical protein RB614_40440 [Phytohabitans sp. ZYX-F-186]|uniref:GATA-type domain-containing protein n=1 Tax=Phytohabitans maris TaxID=3071409 RepID=A0ABU0ZWT8_9ACTN|nr:hypothetical protein [Phytohabitans sp. ZYX-F-186]MDQ7910779.1 hypothetical protein [Phytohabitans sp. ZYX-F-186]
MARRKKTKLKARRPDTAAVDAGAVDATGGDSTTCPDCGWLASNVRDDGAVVWLICRRCQAVREYEPPDDDGWRRVERRWTP